MCALKPRPNRIPSRIDPKHGCSVIGEGHGREIVLVNPSDREWIRRGPEAGSYVLHFGAYGWTRLMVWARCLQDALDEAIDWIEEHAPGLLCDDAVNEAYADAIARGLSEDEAIEEAEVDVTRAGNHGRCIPSYEWGVLAHNPTRAELAEMVRR